MSGDLQIRFQLDNQSHEVKLQAQDSGGKNTAVIGGIRYSIQGSNEGIEVIKKCLAKLPNDALITLSQTGKELKARLWQTGAKGITISTSKNTHKIGLQILNRKELLDHHKIIDNLCKAFEKIYIFPDIAKKCSEYLHFQLKKGVYDSITDPEKFAEAITKDLLLKTNDKHIVFKLNPKLQQNEKSQVEKTIDGKSKEEISPEIEQSKDASSSSIILHFFAPPNLIDIFEFKAKSNIGLLDLSTKDIPYEIKSGLLEQNNKIGYIDYRKFAVVKVNGNDAAELKDGEIRKKAVIKAVQNVKSAESIIIDLRDNGGGRPETVQLLCSLFMDENKQLNTIEWRKGDVFTKEDFNTLSHTDLSPESRLLNQKVIVLISSFTFSAAEEFTNNMKVLGRATIVGEPSGGGANPGDMHEIGDEFVAFIPHGRAVNPIQKGNWEGVGIIPDHMVPAKDALDEAVNIIEKKS